MDVTNLAAVRTRRIVGRARHIATTELAINSDSMLSLRRMIDATVYDHFAMMYLLHHLQQYKRLYTPL